MICPICDRDLPSSERSSHHLIPKLKGGKNGPTIDIHRICHSKIHSIFSESELANIYNTVDMLKSSSDIQSFIKWVHSSIGKSVNNYQKL
jgi:hypothetical protein